MLEFTAKRGKGNDGGGGGGGGGGGARGVVGGGGYGGGERANTFWNFVVLIERLCFVELLRS